MVKKLKKKPIKKIKRFSVQSHDVTKAVKRVKKPNFKINVIEHQDGSTTLEHNGEVKTGKKVTPPSGIGTSSWFLSNPCYWWKDYRGNWYVYCWGGDVC